MKFVSILLMYFIDVLTRKKLHGIEAVVRVLSASESVYAFHEVKHVRDYHSKGEFADNSQLVFRFCRRVWRRVRLNLDIVGLRCSRCATTCFDISSQK